jgi:hypothetical protein
MSDCSGKTKNAFSVEAESFWIQVVLDTLAPAMDSYTP